LTVRTATFLGIDITDRVVSFGTLEQIKEILLAVATMFTSEHSLQVSNADGAFSSNGAHSIIRGVNWYGQLVTVSLDGVVVYTGRVRDIQLDSTGRIATIISEDVMKIPAQAPFVGTATNRNPGDVLLAIARTALADEYIDLPSFRAAGGPARAAGATISYDWPATSPTSCMDAMQQIGALCSISVYVSRSKLAARAFRPYQGSGAGLMFPITDDLIRDVPSCSYDVLNFVNQVTVGYTGGLSVTVNDRESQRVSHVTRPSTLGSGTTILAYNEASARWLGNTALARSSYQRRIVDVVVGPPMNPVDMGDRFPLTSAWFGISAMPGEVVESHRNPDRDETTIKLAELRPA